MSDAIEAKGTTIFVTGVNGHIGNHIVRDLLEQGYNVKGSIRDLEDPLKVDHVRKHASDLNSEDRLELVQADVCWTLMIGQPTSKGVTVCFIRPRFMPQAAMQI